MPIDIEEWLDKLFQDPPQRMSLAIHLFLDDFQA